MSSSNKTAHLELNQWQRSDGICMDDFNADNSKIDAEFGTIPVHKLMDITTTAGAAQIDVDTSGIDIDAYMDFYIMVRLSISKVYVYVNGNTNSTTNIVGSEFCKSGKVPVTLHFSQGAGGVTCWHIGCSSGNDPLLLKTDATAACLNTINLLHPDGYAIPAGSRICVYGVK